MRTNQSRRVRAFVAGLLVSASMALAQGGLATKQAKSEFSPPPISPAVTALIDQDYLKPDERAALRVRHGLWEDSDLSSAALKAQAAIIRGAFADASLDDASAGAEDRAEAMLNRGEPVKALELLSGRAGARCSRIRGSALMDLEKPAEAVAELRAAAEKHTGAEGDDADELTEGARCALLLTRLQSPKAQGVIPHQRMLAILARARDELDRVSWRANLVEGQLLYEKDNYEEVGATVEAALALNPRCAEAYWLFGLLCVDTFDFDRGESIAAKLDELASPDPSAWGACLRAYIKMRQGEGEQAAKLLEPALEKFPKSRLLLAYRAAASAAAFDFAATDAKLAAFDALSPGSAAAYMAVGKAVSGARQYDEAATYLGEAVKRAPWWAEPVVELGLCEFQAGRNQQAMTALETATQLDPQNNRAANSLTLLRELATYASVESDHFIVRCKPGEDEVVAKEMLPPLEEIYARVTGNGPGGIDHKPAKKTVVELYPNHRWFGVRITGMPQLHTIAAATGPVIAMEAPREGPGHFGAFDWRRVVQHEYTHTVTLSRTKNRLPHWFTEASAVYLEDAPRDYSTVQLLARAYETQTLFDMDKINVMFARPEKPTDRSQAYAQGHAMYEFIMDTYGPNKPLELMDAYARGVREGEAFQTILGVSRDDFLPRFTEWLKVKLEQWGMLPGTKSPTIKELLKSEKAEKADDADAEEDEGPTPELIDKWLAQYPESPSVLMLAVRERLKKNGGKADAEMVPLLEKYAAARPVDPLPHKTLAAFYLAGPDAAEAIPHLEYLDAREQHSSGYAIELARRYAAAGDLDTAAKKAARATQIAPYDPANREFAATIALRRKDYSTAERHIRALIVLEPDREVHKQRLEALERLRAEK